MIHYAAKTLAVGCNAHKFDEFRDCVFARLTPDGHCTYQQIDGGCTSPEAFEWMIEQEKQTDNDILTEKEPA